MPERIVPMLARARPTLPRGQRRWSFEVKWDGVRAIAYVQPGRLRLESRNLNEITDAYPEVRGLLGDARDARGGARRRDRRVRRRRPAELRAPAAADARHLAERRPAAAAQHAGRLRDLRPAVPRRPLADGAALPRAARAARGAGARAARPGASPPPTRARAPRCSRRPARRGSRGSSPSGSTRATSPAARTGAWLKIKHTLRQELVIGGWLPGEGRRAERIGALLMGYYEDGDAPLRRAASGPASPSRRSTTSRGGWSRCAATTSPFDAGAEAPAGGACSSSRGWWPRSSSASGRASG